MAQNHTEQTTDIIQGINHSPLTVAKTTTQREERN